MENWPPMILNSAVTETPEAVVKECYRLISFEAGSEPNWDAFKSLFHPNAILTLRVFPGDPAITVMNLDEYAQLQVTEGMKKEGYSEKITEEKWLKHGDLAGSQVAFEIKFGDQAPIPAFDAFQLVHLEGRWWITMIMGEILPMGTPTDF